MKVIAIANFKGGSAKTTSAINIGAGLARLDNRVLLIDTDPQANLTISLGVKKSFKTTYDIMFGNKPSIYHYSDNMDIVPASEKLITIDEQFATTENKYLKLKSFTEGLKDKYDYVIIDCSPSLGLMTLNAFYASDFIFCPVEAEALSFKGLHDLKRIINKIGFFLDGIFITKYNAVRSLSKWVYDKTEKDNQDEFFKTKIRIDVSLAEAPFKGKDIFTYKNGCRGAYDYEKLVAEILTKIDK